MRFRDHRVARGGSTMSDRESSLLEPGALETGMAQFVAPGARILSVGSMPASTFILLREVGCQVVTVSTDRMMGRRIRRFSERVVETDFGHLAGVDSLVRDRFDAILVGDTLGRVADPDRVLRSLGKLLVRDGCLVAIFSNAAHVSARLAMLSDDPPNAALGGSGSRCYSFRSVEDLLQKGGFEIRHVARFRGADSDEAWLRHGWGIPPAVLAYLRDDPEARTHRFLVAAYRLPRADPVRLRHQIRTLQRENEAAHREIETLKGASEVVESLHLKVRDLIRQSTAARQEAAELRVTIKHQAAEVLSLTRRIGMMSQRESELRRLFLDAQDHLARRDQELRASISAVRERTERLPLPAMASSSRQTMDNLAYRELISRIRAIVDGALPTDATVIVVSKGDEQLLVLNGRTGWHYPQSDGGKYAGYYPADSAAAIAHLEGLREAGANYILFPKTAFWWLDHYGELRHHLETCYPQVLRDDDACMIFDLGESSPRANGHQRERFAGWLISRMRILGGRHGK